MPSRMRTPADVARTLASAEDLDAVITAAGLTREQAAELVRKDPRQVRRWLSGTVPLGALELYLAVVAQLDEHPPCKREVAGSTPAAGSGAAPRSPHQVSTHGARCQFKRAA